MESRKRNCGGVLKFHLGREPVTEADYAEARVRMSENQKKNWETRRKGPAVKLLRMSWRTFLDILPSCRWDPNLAMKKVGGLPKSAMECFSRYLTKNPDLQRAIDEKKRECFGSENGIVQPSDIEESDRVRRLVMEELEKKAMDGKSESVQVRALEVLGKAVGLFSDKVEGGGFMLNQQIVVDQDAVSRARSFLTAKPEEVKCDLPS